MTGRQEPYVYFQCYLMMGCYLYTTAGFLADTLHLWEYRICAWEKTVTYWNGNFPYLMSKSVISCPGLSVLLLASCGPCCSQNSVGMLSVVLVYHTFTINLFAKIDAEAVICILRSSKLTRSGDWAFLCIIPNLFPLLLMIIKGFVNPFNRGQSLLAIFFLSCCILIFWYHGHLIVKHGDMAQ